MSEQRNLIIAVILSVVVVFGWQYLVGVPEMEQERARQQQQSQQPRTRATAPAAPVIVDRARALATSGGRVEIDTPTLDGSINLVGARFDDLHLKNYHETVERKREIELLNPAGTAHPYYVEFGWDVPAGATTAVPGPNSQWRLVRGTRLAPGQDVTLQFDNGQGLTFQRTIAVDNQYMFTITDRVVNRGAQAAALAPAAQVWRRNLPPTVYYWVVHEGFIGINGGSAEYVEYSSLADENATQNLSSTGGWIGLTDKYWMAAAIPPQNEQYQGAYRASGPDNAKVYQADYTLATRVIPPGQQLVLTQRLFAGTKIVSQLDEYEDTLGIVQFNHAIDWGWFPFLTRPIFLGLHFIHEYVGNYGIAILILTLFIKVLFYPLADKSYRAMSKMKKLQPEMLRIREVFKDDRMMQQQEMMKLYQKEKVNPVSGCLPMLLQIPVFFALYKVLLVTIELRHAPFFGWITDLSAIEPITVFNLFGLIPWDPGSISTFLMVGPFALLMGFSMWIQTNLNPPPADPTQAKIFGFMPIIFTFIMASFPVGLVLYWAWNNILSIGQQILMMKRTDTPVDLFDRLRGMGKRWRKGEPLEKPAGPPD
jgi:YidC/Oxa1 family membrane protein insertase